MITLLDAYATGMLGHGQVFIRTSGYVSSWIEVREKLIEYSDGRKTGTLDPGGMDPQTMAEFILVKG